MITTSHNFTYAKPATAMEPATLSHQLVLCLFSLVLKEIFHNYFTFLGIWSQSTLNPYSSILNLTKRLILFTNALKIFLANRPGEVVAYFSNVLKLQSKYTQGTKWEKVLFVSNCVL